MQQQQLTFLHGFMGHPSDWNDLRSQLEGTSFSSDQSIVMGALEIEPACDWSGGLEKLALKVSCPSVLVGYSMGARLALGLAVEFPEKVNGLILISGNLGIESDDLRNQRLKHDRSLASEMESLSNSIQKKEFLKRWYQQSVFATVSDSVRHHEMNRKLEKNDWVKWSRTLQTFSVARQPNYWQCLNSIKVPVWMIAGQKDEKYQEIAKRFWLQSRMEHSKSVIVPDSGHIVHREQPEAVVKEIRSFLNEPFC